MLFLVFFLFPISVYAKDTAKSSIAMDIDSMRILYKNNIDERRLIASTTKIMTFLVAINNLDVNKKIIVGDEVNSSYGSNTYIEKGEVISVLDLLYGLMLRSGNDCALVLSKNIKGFVPKMNMYAKRIGMTSTIFQNETGLDDYDLKNYSTARDMAKLSSYVYKNSLYRKIINTYKYETQTNKKSYIWYNRNKMLKKYKYLVGGKTGYTPKAGRTLVTVAKKNDFAITMVSLNDPNHYNSEEEIYNYLFNKYKRIKILNKGKFYINGFFNDVLYVKNDFYYPLTKEESQNIKLIYKIYKLKNYSNNTKIGYIDVKLYNNSIHKEYILVKKKRHKSLLF